MLTESQGVKTEDNDDTVNQDSEMADNSAMQSDDEEGDEREGDEGEEGEAEEGERDAGGDDEGRDETSMMETSIDQEQQEDRDQEMKDSDVPGPIQPTVAEPGEEAIRQEDHLDAKLQPTSETSLNLGPPMHLALQRHEGSPLKNVVLQSPTDPSPMISPAAQSMGVLGFPNAHISPEVGEGASQSGGAENETLLAETTAASSVEDPPMDLDANEFSVMDTDFAPQPLSPNGELSGNLSETPLSGMFGAEELGVSAEPQIADTLPESPGIGPVIGSNSEQQTKSPTPALQETPATEQLAADALPPTEPEVPPSVEQPEITEPQHSPGERAGPSPPAAAGDDDGLDLLGGLERELDRQAAVSSEDVTPAATATAAADPETEPSEETRGPEETPSVPVAGDFEATAVEDSGIDEQRSDNNAAQ